MPNQLTGTARDRYGDFARQLKRSFVWSQEKRGHEYWSAYYRNFMLIASGQMPTIPVPEYDITDRKLPLGCATAMESLRTNIHDLDWHLGNNSADENRLWRENMDNLYYVLYDNAIGLSYEIAHQRDAFMRERRASNARNS